MTSTRLRLVTFNIAHGRGLNPIQGLTPPKTIRKNLREIARLLHEVRADVVALQEIDRNSTWAGSFDHLHYLGVHSKIEHAVFGINNHRQGLLNLSYGNALLSRFPIGDSETVVFGNKSIGEKGFLFAELDVRGHLVPIVNLHFHYRSRAHRMRQFEKLASWLEKEFEANRTRWSMPPIVCGDFNSSRKSEDVVTALWAHLKHFGEYQVFPLNEETFPSPWPSRTLDFVFMPKHCRHAHAAVLPSYLSDHRPVLVEFDLD